MGAPRETVAGEGLDAALVAAVARLADEVLFPGAAEVDAAPLVPHERLDALAAAGLYGLAGPRSHGGLEAAAATATRVTEELARGCLTTAFVVSQHHHAVRGVAAAGGRLAERWLAGLCAGRVRSGVAFSALRRPGAPALLARPVPGGYELAGSAPWVTGWGRIDLVHVGARTADGQVVWSLVDAAPSATLEVTALRLGAVQASGTVSLRFTGHRVPAELVTGAEPYDEWRARDALGLRPNGSHALGIARRCLELAGEGADEVEACRSRLDEAPPEALPAARAAASLLAWRAAGRLVAGGGGRSVLVGGHAERLAREASFLLVFGQTEAIRRAMLDQLAGGERVR